MFIVVSYDISNDKRRNKIFKVLKDYGQWIQYSIFECGLEQKEYLKLRSRLNQLIDEEAGDSIRFYFLCEHCTNKVERIGGIEEMDKNTIII
ncbi:CRISPR-associated endonuclease Cas2 [Orenia metallireducens]|uniref:CRISPR-associated endoribonuclease Cas2 n=1 Tax=Orenia metallireducens TaxID=1413210 RepID=A0A1C0A8B8_9FIRM|nr:CRISPR-associated endonuclease Cas2 [Orenia metallireducens]OCL26495.1 CRISPR-associated endonuclease Cas2 [Orenia metallireducens]